MNLHTTITATLFAICLLQARSISVDDIQTEFLINSVSFDYLWESKYTQIFNFGELKFAALNKENGQSVDLLPKIDEYNLHQPSFTTDNENRFWSATKDGKFLIKLSLDYDLNLKIGQNISNPDDQRDLYMIQTNRNNKGILLSTKHDPENKMVELKVNIYEYQYNKFTHQITMNYSDIFPLEIQENHVAVNEKYFIVFLSSSSQESQQILAFEFNTAKVSVIYENNVREDISKIVLKDEDDIVILDVYSQWITYFPLNDSASAKSIEIDSDIYYFDEENIAVIQDQMLQYYIYYSREFHESQHYDLPPTDPKATITFKYMRSHQRFGLIINYREWYWLENGYIWDKLELTGTFANPVMKWTHAPVLPSGKQFFYEFTQQSVNQRMSADFSMVVNQTFSRNFGYYSNDPNLIEIIALDEENEGKCIYIAIDKYSMEVEKSPNGDCPFRDEYYESVYYTAVIRNQTAEYHDALFLNQTSANVFYNGSTYEIPVCQGQSWLNECTAFGNFYYENGTLAVISQLNTIIKLSVFDLNNGMNQTINAVLSNIGSLNQIDQDNVLIAYPGTSIEFSHFTIFNLHTLSFIWSQIVRKSNAFTTFVQLIPMGVKFDENMKLIEGRVVIGDSYYDVFVYNMVDDSLEQIEINEVSQGNSIWAKKVDDTKISIEFANQTNNVFHTRKVYEFDWEDENVREFMLEVDEDVKFLEY